jgi:hypothetical protein
MNETVIPGPCLVIPGPCFVIPGPCFVIPGLTRDPRIAAQARNDKL